ncbi:MAG: hypothetical protein ABI813_04110 [Bacteroidota bacterium]
MKKNNSNPSKHNATPAKKSSSALAASSKGERATARVKPAANRDVTGASGMRNAGTNVSYEDKE